MKKACTQIIEACKLHVFFIRKSFIRKWGFRGQKNKKVKGYNAPALRKSLSTRFKKF